MATARDLVYGALSTDAPLTALVDADNIYESSAVPDPIPADTPPYIVLRYGIITPDVMNLLDLDVWVHDKPGTYDNVNKILRTAHPVLLAVTGQTEAGWLTSVRWEGESIDLWDDATRTIARYRTYRLVGSGV